MKNNKKINKIMFASLLSGSLLLVTYHGYADIVNSTQDSNKTDSVNLVTDAQISNAIKQQLRTHRIPQHALQIYVANGNVKLGGVIDTDNDASTIIEVAQGTNGVKDVDISRLKVTKSEQPWEDTVITAKVKGLFFQQKLFGEQDIAAFGINVETKNGIVHLSGTADQPQQITTAVNLAKKVKGVQDVISKVQLSPAS